MCSLKVGEVAMRAQQGAVDARGPVKAMIRPERVRIEPQGTTGQNRLPGLVEHLVFLGSFRELRVRLLGGELVKAVQPNDGTSRCTSRARRSPCTCPPRRCACCPTCPSRSPRRRARTTAALSRRRLTEDPAG